MRITMPAHTALYLAKVALAAASRDEVTPVITGVQLTKYGKALRAISTDRYRVHQIVIEHAHTTAKADESVIVPAAALKWIAGALRLAAPRRLERDGARVTIQTRKEGEHDVRVIVRIDTPAGSASSFETLAIRGNYPPISHLVDLAISAPRYEGDIAVNFEYLSAAASLRPASGQPGVIKHTAAPDSPKPGPMLITYEADGITAHALVQPNLMRR